MPDERAPRANEQLPFHVFRFRVDFKESPLGQRVGSDVPLCSGAFSECTGLEATMEPKVIREGGVNYGAAQRAGPVTFATVILRRGITTTRHLWQWFELVNRDGAYAHRLDVEITLSNPANQPQLKWKLDKALPIKFKVPDLNALGDQVGVEELHLAYEGLSMVSV